MLLVLSGAKKNIGDFLIVDRTLKLLAHVLGEEVTVHPRWISLDGQEELVASARAVVVAGGPGVSAQLYPVIYPLFSNPAKLAELGVPLRFVGSGWFAARGDEKEQQQFRFSEQTREMFNAMSGRLAFSARDEVTAGVLRRNGITDVVMSGCPVWYDLRHMGEAYKRPSDVRSIVYTTPQSGIYEKQSMDVLKSIMQRFPEAKITAAFHRGITADEFTPADQAARFTRMAAAYEQLGVEVKDVSYDLERIKFFEDTDLHIGYRVHAHLHFISGRKPSLLLEEDGRGRGFARVLPAPSVAAWKPTSYASAISGVLPKLPARVRHRLPLIQPTSEALTGINAAMDRFIAGDDAPFERAIEKIEATYPVMKAYIERI